MDQKESDVKKVSQDAIQAVVSTIRASNALPQSGDDYNYYASFKGVRQVLSVERAKISRMITGLLHHSSVNVDFTKALGENEMSECVTEANDQLLERIGICLDEAVAPKKEDPVLTQLTAVRAANINASWNKQTNVKQKPPMFLYTAKNIERPQLSFKDRIDNSNNPFIPVIKDKPNSVRPLAVFLEETPLGVGFCHPYQSELDKFEPSADQLTRVEEPEIPPPYSDTPLVMVSQLADLEKMIGDLRGQKEIAVDLEHHSYRSFQGFTCLMQVSTRKTDYIVDTLKLRSNLHLLNEVFTDPKITKVFHGADSDIEWLQRDFGVYVVNMFDTGQASRLLSLPHFSLAFLLKLYCDVDANKQFQLADWRIRPLPDELKNYAREDTHYLLYIYERMKNDLVDASNGSDTLVKNCFSRSTVICGKRYEKPLFTESSFYEFYKKSKRVFNNKQLYALREIYRWRDRIARESDESTGYTLPNHMLLTISELLPREQQGILSVCNPLPPLVKQCQTDLHKIIIKAREVTAEQAPHIVAIEVAKTASIVDLDHMIVPIHDLKNYDDTSSALLDSDDEDDNNKSKEKQTPSLIPLKKMASLSVFDIRSDQAASKTSKKEDEKKFTSPYERFLNVLSFEKVYKTTEKPTVSDQDRIDRLHDFFKNLAGTSFSSQQQQEQPEVVEKIEDDEEEEEEVKVLEPDVTSEQNRKRAEKRKRPVDLEDNAAASANYKKQPIGDVMKLDDQDEILLEPRRNQQQQNNNKKRPADQQQPGGEGVELSKQQKKRRRKKRAQVEKNLNLSGFKPFDYNAAGQSNELVPVSEPGAGRGKPTPNRQKKRQFDPYKSDYPNISKNKKNNRFRVTQNKQTQFMFDGNQKPEASSTSGSQQPKPNWPQRNKRRH